MKSARYRTSLGSTSLPASTNFLLAVAIAILLSACGGGGGESKTGVVGTGDPTPPADALTASGPLTAVGTAGIGATGLDDRAAAIFINTQAGQSFTALKLGMIAEVSGTIPTNATSATAGTANTIVGESAVIGTVIAVDANNSRLTVGPMAVQVDQNTIFEGTSSLSSMTVGNRIEVYGLPQADSRNLLATRIVSLPAAVGTIELLGVATNVTSFQFALQGISVSTAGVTSVITPTGTVPGTTSIVENTRVRVVGAYSPTTNSIAANQIVAGIPVSRIDNSIIVLDGVVQSVGTNGRIRLNDTDVDVTATNAANAPVGARVQVKGRKTAGVLTAIDFRLIAAGERIQYTAQGDITNFISTANFTVRGETINASTATFVGGTAANLANGRTVRVKAQVTGGRLMATEVTLL
jgi:hypothetical protein